MISNHQKRFKGFDEKIMVGMSLRDRQVMLLELYDVEVSEALISSVTDAVLDDVRSWQSRPSIHSIVSFDCIVVKSRQEGKAVINQFIWREQSPWRGRKSRRDSGFPRTKELIFGSA